jgi:hypothetical protein
MKTATCITCSKPFEYQPAILYGRETFVPRYRGNCISEHSRTQARLEQQGSAYDLAREWERICPAIYRNTDVNRLSPAMRKYAETCHTLARFSQKLAVGLLPPGFEEPWLREHVHKILFVEGGRITSQRARSSLSRT